MRSGDDTCNGARRSAKNSGQVGVDHGSRGPRGAQGSVPVLRPEFELLAGKTQTPLMCTFADAHSESLRGARALPRSPRLQVMVPDTFARLHFTYKCLRQWTGTAEKQPKGRELAELMLVGTSKVPWVVEKEELHGRQRLVRQATENAHGFCGWRDAADV